jgi:hypothetical protein
MCVGETHIEERFTVHTKFYPSFFSQSYLQTQTIIGRHKGGSDMTVELIIIYSAFFRHQ